MYVRESVAEWTKIPEWSKCKSQFMKVWWAVYFRLETMAAHDELANKQNNPCFIGLGSVGASQPSHFDT